jgi:galactokinase
MTSFASLDAHFERLFGDDSTAFTVIAPGRVNLIGEHVDYNGGLVLPMAISLSAKFKLRPREDGAVLLHAANLDESAQFSPGNIHKRGEWIDYVAGVAQQLQKAGVETRGFEGVIESTVPAASGLSSSAALEVGAARAFLHLAGRDMEALDLALLCQAAENQFVGVNCGIMDQAAVAACRAGHALLLDCRSLETRHIPFDLGAVAPGYCVVVADSAAPRELAASAYNERRAQCEAGLAILAKYLPPAAHGFAPSLRDVSPEVLEAHGGELEPVVLKRVRHVVREIARVQRAVEVLEAGDLSRFGALMNDSHDSLRDDYEVSSRELEALVGACREVPGVLGSRMTGAGFGGCTVTLVERAQAEVLAEQVGEKYFSATGRSAKFYVCAAEDGARVVA